MIPTIDTFCIVQKRLFYPVIRCMASNNENRVDPTVETIVEMFPEEFLRNTAQETGVVKRERKIDPVILFWVLTLGFGVIN